MKKIKLLRLIVKTKQLFRKYFPKKKIERKDSLVFNQNTILSLLFHKELTTQESIELLKIINRKAIKELESRERNAKNEITIISSFLSEDNSFEKGKLINLEFQKI